MTGDVRCGEGCWRIVVGNDDVGAGAGGERADGVAEGCGGQLGVAIEEHGRRLGPCRRRVAGLMLVKQVGNLERLEHVAGISIAAEADANAALDHAKHRCASDGIAHIGLGIMNDVCF